jgi:phosphatidylglycerophosphatase C
MVERQTVTLRTLSPGALIAELERLRPRDGTSVLCFDGDGTLWSGDVGEDLFNLALERDALREPARESLEAEARNYGLSARATLAQTARALFDAYLDGSYPERDVCEMMTWCYAGYSAEELRQLSRDALTERALPERLNRELESIFDWARESGVRSVVVSASPRCVVEEAASLWGVSPKDIVASTPRFEAGRVTPALAHPLPYAEAKCTMGRALFGDAFWLASFGDNIFDIEMLLAARIGVAVRPKVSLRTRLPDLESVVLLA